MDLKQLHDPFAADEIEWRAQQVGDGRSGPYAMVLAYVTNRAIMNRLDDVVGPDNWQNDYREAPGGGVLCGLRVRVLRVPAVNEAPPIYEWVTKWDGADQTDIEATKGGLSNAMKRSAVQWGIGRYLYNLETNFAEVSTERQRGSEWTRAKTKNGVEFWWKAPDLPAWALPGGSGVPGREAAPAPARARKAKAAKPGDFVIPMGPNQDKKVSEVDKETLVKMADWCREKGKYLDLAAAIDAYLGE